MRRFFSRAAPPILGIELSSSRVKVVEADPTPSGVRISKFAIFDYLPDSQELARAQLREGLDEKGFRATSAVVAIAGPDVALRLLELPPLSHKERTIVLEREVVEATGAPIDDVAYGFQQVGTIESGPGPQDHWLLAHAPMSRVLAVIDFVERCALQPDRVTPLALALSSLVGLLHPIGVLGVLYVVETTAHLIIVRDGQYRFNREIQSGVAATPGGEHVPDITALSGELRRSIMYFKQQFRGENVERMLVCGDGNIQTISEELGAALKLPVVRLDVTRAVDTSLLRGERGDFHGMSSELAGPLGLVMGAAHAVNMLPSSLRRRSLAQWISGVAAAGLLLVALAVGYQQAAAKVEKMTGELQRIEQEKNALELQRAELLTVEQEREYDKARTLFLEQMHRPAMFYSQLLKEIAALVPRAVILQSLEVKKTAEARELRLDGEVWGENLASSLTVLDEFYKDMSNSSFVTDATLRLTKTGNRVVDETESAESKERVGFLINARLNLKDFIVIAPGS